ncbi:MAG: sodium:solute symporter family protein [Methanomassiliicoccaceae archaeon]|nr:sodium:solute symporter family protein [Methanomassiliicoccaceae archaeon]
MVNAIMFGCGLAVFIAITLFLGWYGYKNTKNKDNFLIGKNKSNPILIGLAYGATFLSTSAIVGFGGMASRYGMGMIWLVFLNLFVGLIIAFIVFGKRTRKLNVKLGALTFADFLGKRFKSPLIRIITAVIVLVGMPIYCAAVLIGGVNFLLPLDIGITKNIAILVISAVVLLYVTYGGIIAVMYNDALQAAIMFVGMFAILIVTYLVLGDLTTGGVHESLTDLWGSGGKGNFYTPPVAPAMEGMQGWTMFPEMGSNAWIYMVSTILMGVGIGALAQPQLAARFMTAKDSKTLNKSLVIGSIFMIVIVGTAYTVGALTNLYFVKEFGMNSADYIFSLNGAVNIDLVIPTFVTTIFGSMGTGGEAFVIIFILGILCASISTIGALLHTMGAAAGHDLWSEAERKRKKKIVTKPSLTVTRAATVVMMIVVIILAYLMPTNIIAKATSIFMGLTAAALLPAYTNAVFAKSPNALAAKMSMLIGSVVWLVWALFINASIGGMLGTQIVTTGQIVFIDPLILALPISAAVMILTCLIKPSKGDPAADIPDAEPSGE